MTHRQSQDELVTSAVLCACEEGNVIGLSELLQSSTSININLANQLGETGVHMAAGAGQLETLQFLVKRGAEPDQPDKHGETALFWAVRHGHPESVRYLLDEGADQHRKNKSGETVMHVGVRYSQMSIVQLLLSLGSGVNEQDEHGETPLHIAAWHGFPQLLDIILIRPNNINNPCPPQHRPPPDLALTNKEEESALHCAAGRGHVECVETLVDGNAPLDQQDKNGETPLHLALRRQHMDIALLLLSKSCSLDIQDNNGDSPLHVACREGLLTAVQTLCHLGATPDLLNKNSLSPLHVAAKEGQAEIVRILCLAGCNINIKNKEGLTPEVTAKTQGNTLVSELLSRLKTDSIREGYVEQLSTSGASLKRIKLKLFGHSGVGKSRLVGSLQTGKMGAILEGFTRRWSEAGSVSSKDEGVQSDVGSSNSLDHQPSHAGYTRGIDVNCINVPSSDVGELSCWEFSGYEAYHQVYDHFVGNVDCIHAVLFKASDPTEVQYAQLVYWFNFLKGRIMPTEPIGHCGAMCRRSKVVVIGTHADACSPVLNKNGDAEWVSQELDSLLDTIKLRFGTDFEIHPQLILTNTLSHNCTGLKSLKSYLAPVRNQIIQNLPKWTGFLDGTLTFLGSLRKQHVHFPVLTWPRFIQLVRNEVNPLAGEPQCRQLIQQLQLMGEVVYLKGEAAEMDYVIVSVEWLCEGVIGQLLSAEQLSQCRPDGRYLAPEFHLLFPDVPDILDLLQILDALQLCTQVDMEGDVQYEFPCFNFLPVDEGIWEAQDTMVYGGLRIQAPHGCERGFNSIFPRLQVQLRRSMLEFQDPVDAELMQWQWCSKMCSGLMEGLVEFRRATPDSPIRQDSIAVTVRGPPELATSCFYFMEDLAQLSEQTITEVAPGLPLERHFLSPKDLAAHALTPAVYPPEAVMAMQQKESISLKNNQEGEEPFTDVVCFASRDVAMALTLGIDLPVAQLQLSARRELAALLDPEESLGRDWSILAVRLGLTEQLPEVDSSGPILSQTDQLLAEWALRYPDSATVGNLCDILCDLGRKDTVDALFKLVPLYMFAAIEDTGGGGIEGGGGDLDDGGQGAVLHDGNGGGEDNEGVRPGDGGGVGGVIDGSGDSGLISATNSNTSQRSCSTLSH